MPLLSIIIPVYNKEEFIDACIESILAQDFKDFELILVNDGSTDSSGEKCEHYCKVDDRIKVIHQTNKGVSSARNIGVEMANSIFIGFADADDHLEKDMYQILISDALTTNADIVACGIKKIFPYKEELFYGTGSIKDYGTIQGLSAFFKKEIAHSTYDKIYRSDIVKSIKFKGAIYEDVLYNFFAFKKADKIVFNDVVKYNYIIRENSVSMSAFNKKHMDIRLFTKEILSICENEIPELIDEARVFDLVANISLLNIILLNNKNVYPVEFNMVADNLKEYTNFVKCSMVSKKHKYALKLFFMSPTIYTLAMKSYCFLFDAEVLKRT